MQATLKFATVHGDKVVREIRVDGVATLAHADMIGQGLVGRVSIELLAEVYLAIVWHDARNFICHAAPSSIMSGVRLF